MQWFLLAIRVVYEDTTTCTQDLRAELIKIVMSHADRLLGYKRPRGTIYPFKDLLDKVQVFAADFKAALYDKREATMRRHLCSLCHKGFWTEMETLEKICCPYCGKISGVGQ